MTPEQHQHQQLTIWDELDPNGLVSAIVYPRHTRPAEEAPAPGGKG